MGAPFSKAYNVTDILSLYILASQLRGLKCVLVFLTSNIGPQVRAMFTASYSLDLLLEVPTPLHSTPTKTYPTSHIRGYFFFFAIKINFTIVILPVKLFGCE